MVYIKNISYDIVKYTKDKHFYIKSDDDRFVFELVVTPNNLIRRYRVMDTTGVHSFPDDDYDYDETFYDLTEEFFITEEDLIAINRSKRSSMRG